MNQVDKEALIKSWEVLTQLVDQESWKWQDMGADSIFEKGFKAGLFHARSGEAVAWLFTNPANGTVGATTSKHVADLYQDAEKLFTHSQPNGDPVEFDFPEYSHEGMGCGLEDRGITDRYEACQYGFNEAIESVARMIDSMGPLFTHSQPADQPREVINKAEVQ
jgi:hypothetical protein